MPPADVAAAAQKDAVSNDSPVLGMAAAIGAFGMLSTMSLFAKLLSRFDFDANWYGLPLGALDEDPGVKPRRHVFVAYKAPPRATGTMGSPYERGLAAALGGGAAADPGPLIERILCCWQALLARFDKVPSQGTNADLRQWLCDTLQGLLEFLTEYPTTDCRLLARAQALVCPDPSDYQTDDEFRLALRKAIERLAEVAAEQLKHCVCEALMPPCRMP